MDDGTEEGPLAASPEAVRRTLLAARAVLRGGARPQRPLDRRRPQIDSMLAEIAETVLVRRLVFSGTGGRRLVVEAGQGRMTRVVDIQPASARSPDSAALMEGKGLGRDDAAAAAACLDSFAAEAALPAVVAEPLPPSAKAAEGGISPADLRRHLSARDWAPPAAATAPALPAAAAKPKPSPRPRSGPPAWPRVETLPEALRARLGVALRGVGVTAERGRVDVLAEAERFPIGEVLRTAARAPRPTFLERALPGPSFIALLGASGRDPALAVCRDPRDTLSLCVTTEAFPAAVEAWRGHETLPAALG